MKFLQSNQAKPTTSAAAEDGRGGEKRARAQPGGKEEEEGKHLFAAPLAADRSNSSDGNKRAMALWTCVKKALKVQRQFAEL